MHEHKKEAYARIERDARRLAEEISHHFSDDHSGESGEFGGSREEKYMKLQEMKERQKEKWRQMQHVMQKKGKEVDRYAHEHVWKTVAIAAGVGALVGMMTKKKRRR